MMLGLSERSTQSKLGGLQGLRGFAVVLVVYYHMLTAVYSYHGGALGSVLSSTGQIGQAGVDIFFTISGFIMSYTRKDSMTGFSGSMTFLKHRFKRVIPLYWFWTAIVIALWFFKFVHRSVAFPDSGTIIGSLLLWPMKNVIEPFQPILSQGWTLSFEAYFYIFFAVAIMVRVPTRLMVLFLCAVYATIYLVARAVSHEESVLYLTSSPLICEFILGMIAAQIVKGLSRSPVNSHMGYAAIAVSVIAFLVMLYLTSYGIAIDKYRVVIFGVPAFAIVLGVVIYDLAHPVTSRVLLYIGNASYSIYLSHGFLSMLAGAALKRGLGHNVSADVLCIVGTVAIVVVSSLTYLTIEKPMLRLVHYQGRPAGPDSVAASTVS
ncbi:acyltransferase 3 [Caballeronia arationis]|uniref:acyltransferase family protein n=1 Tax=Caballeronia arationis TaxID=1777142 RepID=UPI00074CE6D3|nr:acyltransferase [Caballeronia arationis]SAL07586.1 acyltransferase 3 [Caballeronia arationis]